MSAAAVARETGERLARADAAGLNATLHWSQALLDAEAARVDAMAKPGPLAGMPIAIKDNIVTVEQPTTCALPDSRGLPVALQRHRGRAPPSRRARMIAAKTNMDEFAMGSSTEHSAFGRVQHPLDPDRVPGRLVRRLGGARRGRRGPGRARLRDRWLGPPTGELLRSGRREAELRPGEPLRPRGVRLLARLHLGLRPDRGRRRPGA